MEKIDKHSVVSVSLVLTVNNAQGEVIDKTTEDQPGVFLFGTGVLLPKFEENLKGLKKDDKFAFGIKSDEAYGPYDPDQIVEYDKSAFVIDGVIEELILGGIVHMEDDLGNQIAALVKSIENDMVRIDLNHPLTGIDLYYAGVVLNIREATLEERNNGLIE